MTVKGPDIQSLNFFTPITTRDVRKVNNGEKETLMSI